MTPDEARQTLETEFSPFLAQPLTLTYGDRTWTPTVAEIGVQLEIDNAIQEAYAAGRQHNPLINLSEVFVVWQHGIELPLHLTVNQDVMQQYLTSHVNGVDQPAVDAELEIDGTLVRVKPSASGQQLLIDETLQEITAAVQDLSPQQVALRTRELQPRLSDTVVQAGQQQIAALIANPLMIKVGDQEFSWTIDDLARLIRVNQVSGDQGDSLAVSFDADQIRQKITAIGDASAVKGVYPRVDWNGGTLTIVKEGTSGERIDEARAFDLISAALENPNGDRTVSLSFITVPPPVTADNLQSLGITDLISIGKSDFTGSAAYRVTNIKAGMALLDNILIAPGEEFSFNNTVGRIDASNGFVEGYAIVQNRTQLEWGGGICQDSTTIFRAAFWAGLPITERWGHSFYISWYDKYAFGDNGNGPGMDATIFTGGPDLKFLNDTGHWLLIQTSVDTSSRVAEVRLYGTDTGREVLLEGPTISNRVPAPSEPVYVAEPKIRQGTRHQSDKARGGMQIDFTRIVKQNGQVIESRGFVTKFRPWPDIFEVNPADLGPDGKPLPTATPTVEGQQPTTDPGQQQPTTDPGQQQPTTDPGQQPQETPQPAADAG
ncbi:MAG: vanomycin resistance protein VanB [Oscillochloris sp.]|nr:vanomycin resistance protein VanB [Oscillochloris sp.]